MDSPLLKSPLIIQIIITFNILLITGCASNGVYSSSGIKITDVQTAFKNGDIRLNCDVICSGKFGFHRPEMKKLYNEGKWNELMLKVTSIGYSIDLAYYYLGRSAEGLEHYEAARVYYSLARASFKCGGALDICDDFEFPRNLVDRENIITVMLSRSYDKIKRNNTNNSDSHPDIGLETENKSNLITPIYEPEKELKPNPVTGKLE